MRTYIQLDLGKRPSAPNEDVDITLDDARHLVAVEYGFENWNAVRSFAETAPATPMLATKPVRIKRAGEGDEDGAIASSRDWHEIVRLLEANSGSRLDAGGEMSDDVLALISRVELLTDLSLGGSRAVTDDGIQHLARLQNLKRLDLRETAITDRGLSVLRQLRQLEAISLAQTAVTDEGVRELAECHQLCEVDLAGTPDRDLNRYLVSAGGPLVSP